MKKRNGFTLVEILAVIVIIGLIALIIAPIALGTINRSKQSMYDNQIGEIKAAAVAYTADFSTSNAELSQVGVQHVVTLATLGSLGYIDLPIKNPLTGEDFDASDFDIGITRGSNGIFVYDVAEDGLDIVEPTTLTLFGNNPDTIACAATGNYTDLGAAVSDPLDEDAANVYGTPNPLSKKNAGQYTLTYSYTSSLPITVTKTRTVNITNTNLPTISIAGGVTHIDINEGDSFTAPTATATDVCDGTLSVNVTSNVVPTVAGNYTVTYTATNLGSTTKTSIVTVTVVSTANLDTSGANVPTITSNMIPVYWNGSVWKKADSNNANASYKWYDYSSGTKMWANAVTVTAASRSDYQNAAMGTTINEADILTYFVWIPRYKYMIPSGSGARQITVAWESGTPTKSNGDAITTYLTHPAYTFGTTELTGFWAGKFEVGYLGATSQTEAEQDVSTSNKILIKPSVYAWRNIHTAYIHTVSRAMEATRNIYGFTASELDTHALIPTEWGALAYLSRSVYGKNDEVWKNPHSDYLTGQAGTSVNAAATLTTDTYYTANGKQTSITGTVYGVYDMSGGSSEYVMGSYNDMSGYDAVDNSGFNGVYTAGGSKTDGLAYPASKYYVKLTTNVETTACGGGICYGQAYSETQDWYGDRSVPTNSVAAWQYRSGDYGDTTTAGVFSYSNISCGGCNDPSYSFRIAVAIGA